MRLDDQLGQMLVFGWSADDSGAANTINDHARALFDEFRVGGVALFARNLAGLDKSAVAALTGNLQVAAREAGLPPLLIGIDQEGGRVARLGPPHFEKRPPARSIGAQRSDEAAFDAARAIGGELREAGVNWDFAPVLDVDSNPANPIIGDRSYGPDSALVARLGAAAVRGFQEGAGVLACGKHFPGHGDTDVDSHLALPRVSRSRESLERTELPPFRAAIAAGVGSLMTTHILFPDLDPDLPATLSPAILTGLLRGDLGFEGLIVSDDLEMNGVAGRWGEGEAAALSAIAGADMLLCCHARQAQRRVAASLAQALREGRLTRNRLSAANEKIRLAKERWIGADGRSGGWPGFDTAANR